MSRPKIPPGTINCPDLSGHDHAFSPDTLRFRPAAYGLLIHRQKILLSLSRFTGKWDLPGGGVEPWEDTSAGMIREFYEETGVRVNAGPLLHFEENFISFFGRPFHSLRFYYRVEMAQDEDPELNPEHSELLDLRWWPQLALPEEDMNGYEAMIIQKAFTHPDA